MTAEQRGVQYGAAGERQGRHIRSYPTDVRSTAEHCAHCFDVLLAHFDGMEPPRPEFEDEVCPLFITWKKLSSRTADQYKLRGCIGTLEPKRLTTAVAEYAIVSSLRDRRFIPICPEEVEVLKCTVSLLSNFERMARWGDWQLGLHGLVVEFQNPATHTTSTATFLPDVPRVERWGQRQTIDSLIRKAGFLGPIDEAMRQQVRLTRYQASAVSLTYQEYMALRRADSHPSYVPNISSLPTGTHMGNMGSIGSVNIINDMADHAASSHHQVHDAPGIKLKSGSPQAVSYGQAGRQQMEYGEVTQPAPVLNG